MLEGEAGARTFRARPAIEESDEMLLKGFERWSDHQICVFKRCLCLSYDELEENRTGKRDQRGGCYSYEYPDWDINKVMGGKTVRIELLWATEESWWLIGYWLK